jgi:LAS superfamily LD-carboxypeptidase LdcB
MSIQLRGLHPEVRAAAEWVLAFANQYGVRPVVTSGFRSWHEQLELRRKYEAGESRFPANLPGDSAHNFGLAWDAVLPEPLRDDPAYEAWWKALREYVGFEVPANDTIHAQVPGWRSLVG